MPSATVADRQPKPPFPEQHQKKPGIESKLDPAPRYEAARYRAAGKLEGPGVALYPGGARYEGAFVAGLPEGQGRIVFPDGTAFEGLWKAGQPVRPEPDPARQPSRRP